MKNCEMNEKDLENVAGGKLTKEAEDWVMRNRSEVVRRAGTLGFLADYALGLIRSDTTVYDVPALKKAIKDNSGINVDDLN